MAFARDQAEFDSLYNEMTAKAVNLGYNEILRWNIEQAKKIAQWRQANRASSR